MTSFRDGLLTLLCEWNCRLFPEDPLRERCRYGQAPGRRHSPWTWRHHCPYSRQKAFCQVQREQPEENIDGLSNFNFPLLRIDFLKNTTKHFTRNSKGRSQLYTSQSTYLAICPLLDSLYKVNLVSPKISETKELINMTELTISHTRQSP